MLNVKALLFGAIILMTLNGCVAWEKTSTPIDQAVDIGKVKIMTGSSLTLGEATEKGGLMVVHFNNQTSKYYRYINFYESHYFGYANGKLDSLNHKNIKAIFSHDELITKEYRSLGRTDDGYFAIFRDTVFIDTNAIHGIYKEDKEGSNDRTAGTMVGAFAIGGILLYLLLALLGALLSLLFFWR